MDSTHTLEGAMAQARAALETNQFVRVCELLESYRSQAWDNSQFLILYGVALCNSGHAQEALEVLERSVVVTPTATTHYNLGQCHQMLGDLNNAKLCYVQAVAHSPGHIKANNALQEIRGMTLAEDRGASRLLTEPQALQESVIPSSAIPSLPPMQSPSDRYFDPTASAEPPKPKGPRTPEQIAMDEADKLEEWDRIRREYVTNGVKYGAICGAILFAVVVLVFSFLGSTMAMISGGGEGGFGGILKAVFFFAIFGAVFGSVVGLVVALRDGGTFDGIMTGILVPVLCFQVLGRILGWQPGAILLASSMFGFVGAVGGALIGWATATSIND